MRMKMTMLISTIWEMGKLYYLFTLQGATFVFRTLSLIYSDYSYCLLVSSDYSRGSGLYLKHNALLWHYFDYFFGPFCTSGNIQYHICRLFSAVVDQQWLLESQHNNVSLGSSARQVLPHGLLLCWQLYVAAVVREQPLWLRPTAASQYPPPPNRHSDTHTHTPLDEIMPSNSAAKASRERCRGALTALALVLTCQCGVGQGSQSQMEVCFEAGATLIVRGIWNQTRIGNGSKRFPFLSMFVTRVRQAPKESLQVTLHTCAVLEFVFGMSSVAMAPPHNDLLFLC